MLRTLALQAVLIMMTAIAARQSDAAIAAHQVAMRIWSLFVFALDAIAIAGRPSPAGTWAAVTSPRRGRQPGG